MAPSILPVLLNVCQQVDGEIVVVKKQAAELHPGQKKKKKIKRSDFSVKVTLHRGVPRLA